VIIQQLGELNGIRFCLNYDTSDDDGCVDEIQAERDSGQITWREAGFLLHLLFKARCEFRKRLREASHGKPSI